MGPQGDQLGRVEGAAVAADREVGSLWQTVENVGNLK